MSDDPTSPAVDVLEVRVRDFETFAAESADALASATDDDGGDDEQDPARLVFETPEQLFEAFTPERVTLINEQDVAGHATIGSLADALDRDFHAVLDDLHALAGRGIVDEPQTDDPRERPVLRYDDIRIEVSLPSDRGAY